MLNGIKLMYGINNIFNCSNDSLKIHIYEVKFKNVTEKKKKLNSPKLLVYSDIYEIRR